MSEYEALAKSVIKQSLRVKAKENVIVECWTHGLPVAAEFVYQLRAAGAHPMLLVEDEEALWRSAATLPSSKLGKVGSHEWKALDEADAYVFVPGPADITKIREIGWERWTAATRYNDEWYKRARKNRLRGARIGLGYVTSQRAAAYGFDVDAWRAMVLEASSVDPREVVKAGRGVAAALSRYGRLEITAPNGTRFACDLKGRESRLDDGVVSEADLDDGENMANIPAGEAYVVPDVRSAEGTIVFDRPVAILGRWIRGLSMAFDDGRLTKWSASENEDMVRPDWERAKGDKDRLGYIDIGLNPMARTGFLQDVIVAGNVYVAVGDNEEAGGRNKTDFFLGASLTGATVTMNGKAIVRDGSLVL